MTTGTTTTTNTTTNESPRRPEVERLFDQYNVAWKYEADLPLTRINEKASFGNQARIDQPLMDDLLEQYVVARTVGDEFPAIVVQETRADKPVIIVDGNHRYASAKEVGDVAIPAYVIKAKPETIRVLMTELNVINGRGLSHKERLYHAFFLIDQGTTQEKAAEVMRLPLKQLRTAWALEVANRRAAELGVKNKAWNDLSQHARIRIGQIFTDEAFADMVKLVTRADLTGQEVSALVTEVNKSRSVKAQLDRIAQEATFATAQIQETAGGRIPRRQNPKNALRMHLAALTKVNLDDIPQLVTEDEGDVLAEVCLDAAEVLRKLADKLTTPQR